MEYISKRGLFINYCSVNDVTRLRSVVDGFWKGLSPVGRPENRPTWRPGIVKINFCVSEKRYFWCVTENQKLYKLVINQCSIFSYIYTLNKVGPKFFIFLPKMKKKNNFIGVNASACAHTYFFGLENQVPILLGDGHFRLCSTLLNVLTILNFVFPKLME